MKLEKGLGKVYVTIFYSYMLFWSMICLRNSITETQALRKFLSHEEFCECASVFNRDDGDKMILLHQGRWQLLFFIMANVAALMTWDIQSFERRYQPVHLLWKRSPNHHHVQQLHSIHWECTIRLWFGKVMSLSQESRLENSRWNKHYNFLQIWQQLQRTFRNKKVLL